MRESQKQTKITMFQAHNGCVFNAAIAKADQNFNASSHAHKLLNDEDLMRGSKLKLQILHLPKAHNGSAINAGIAKTDQNYNVPSA